MVNPREVFVDATHVKACANNKKVSKEIVRQEALFYEEQLKEEINTDREKHNKKPLKDKNNNSNDDNDNGCNGDDLKEEKCSAVDPDSGGFTRENTNKYSRIL